MIAAMWLTVLFGILLAHALQSRERRRFALQILREHGEAMRAQEVRAVMRAGGMRCSFGNIYVVMRWLEDVGAARSYEAWHRTAHGWMYPEEAGRLVTYYLPAQP